MGGVVLLRDGEQTAVYFCESMDVALVPLRVHGPLKEFAKALRYPFGDDVPTIACTPISSHSARSCMLPLLADAPFEPNPASAIGRLTVNISNRCNLRCSYCYADHGRYQAPESLMPAERAAAIVERLLRYYNDVKTVQFFGGEPLLNLPAINATGEAVDAAVRSGHLKRCPSMTATTNGTLSSARVIETLKRWHMSLVVSWDGPASIHDAARPTQSGGSSYVTVRRTIERLQAVGIPFDVECTYNTLHRDAGFSVVDLMNYFYDAVGIERVHIPPVSLPGLNKSLATSLSSNTLVPLYREATRRTVDNVFSGSGPTLLTALGIVERLAMKNRTPEYCPAFFRQLSVAEDGSLYPCFMFIGDQVFNMGNLLYDELPSERSVRVINRYFRDVSTESSDTHRWYAPLSGGCVANDYFTSGTLAVRHEHLRVAMIEECIMGIARNRRQLCSPTVA